MGYNLSMTYAENAKRPDPLDERTYVYILSAAKTKFVKVGYAKNLLARRRELQTGCPHELKQHFAIRTTVRHARALERALHLQLKDKAVRGEWFRIDPDEAMDIAFDVLDEFGEQHNMAHRPIFDGDPYLPA